MHLTWRVPAFPTVIGAALVAVIVWATLGSAQGGQVGPVVRVDGIPGPDQIVRLRPVDLPYIVPVETKLVVTGLGISESCGGQGGSIRYSLHLDGEGILAVELRSYGYTASYENLWPGIVADGGTSVDVCGPESLSALILGYLTR